MRKSDISQIPIALSILFLIATYNTACKKELHDLDDNIMAPTDEIVVWLKPNRTHEEYVSWRDDFMKKYYGPDVNEIAPCGSCDNTLLVLKGEGIKNFIQTGGTVSGSTRSSISSPTVTPRPQLPPTGESGPMFVSRNWRITFSKPGSSSNSSSLFQGVHTYSGSVVKVAVLDTGVDSSELNNFRYNSSGSSCITGANSGWNFINQTPNYNDDNNIKHGTTITRFITNEIVKYKGNKIEILPVKTHTKDGVSDLSHILCALAYAKERGANIINASFGFYLPQTFLDKDSINPDALLLKEFVHHYLTENNILLIAAAGNEDYENEKAAASFVQVPISSAWRNLDNVAFLPASLAQIKSFQNVIAVTTVHNSTGTVSPRQNYSPNVVDLGVNADVVMGDYYVFSNPLSDSTETVEGSSFAAAIVTGMLSANYDKYKSVFEMNNYTKDEIWNKLSPIVESDPELMGKIKGGRYVKK
jgi:hypothetical protein